MTTMLVNLLLGILLEIGIFFVVRRFTEMGAGMVAAAVAVIALSVLLPYVLVSELSGDVIALYIAVFSLTAYILGILGSKQHPTQRRERQSRWIPLTIVGFFVVVFAVDVVFVMVSKEGVPTSVNRVLTGQSNQPTTIHTAFPGVVVNNYFKKEASYNDYLKQMQAQQQLGWQIRKGWLDKKVHATEPAIFQVMVASREGRVIDGAEISGVFIRPSDSRDDQRFHMREVSPGRYQTQVQLPRSGQWDVIATIRKGTQQYELRARTVIH